MPGAAALVIPIIAMVFTRWNPVYGTVATWVAVIADIGWGGALFVSGIRPLRKEAGKMSTPNARQYPPKSPRRSGGWPTIGEHITAVDLRSAADGVPDPDWLPWPPTARNCPLILPRGEHTPYRVWEVMELRAHYVRWPQIAARLGMPEHVVRDWIHKLGNR